MPDAEFEAFLAGHPFGAGLPTFEHPQYGGPAMSSGHDFSHAPLPDWASDFQSLHLGEARSSPIPQSQFRQEAPIKRNLPGGWQQDLMRHQGRQIIHQQPVQQQFNGFGQIMYQNRSYPMLDGAITQLSPIAQAKQPQQEDLLDEEAFERAFEAAKLEVELVEQQVQQEQSQGDQALSDYQMQLALLEQQKKRSLLLARQQRDQAQHQKADIELGQDVIINGSADLSTRSDHLVEQDLKDSDLLLQQDEDQRADPQLHDEADDLARTAGQLLDSVRHDQSQKFQDSSFLALMRQLRDREVRVEGDRMIDVSTSLSPNGPKHYHNGPAEMITCRVLGCERVDD